METIFFSGWERNRRRSYFALSAFSFESFSSSLIYTCPILNIQPFLLAEYYYPFYEFAPFVSQLSSLCNVKHFPFKNGLSDYFNFDPF